jgi:hypothetical protein
MSADVGVAALLAALDEAYDKRSWHGTNLRGAIARIEPPQVTWRPGPDRHNVWELVVHAAYWKYVIRKRITRGARGGFPIAGSNFVARPGRFEAAAWQADLDLLADQHRQLRATVAALADADLVRPVGGRPLAWTVRGGAAHDLYHAGQIQLLKTLTPARRTTPAARRAAIDRLTPRGAARGRA